MNLDQVIIVGLKFCAVLLLVLLNGFFVAAEFALVKLRRTQLDTLVAKGHHRARMALKLITHLDATLSATQLGITSASLGLGWVGEPVFFAILAPVMKALHIQSVEAAHTISFVVGFAAITFLHIVAGELTPKYIAIKNPLATSLWAAYPIRLFYQASYPFIWIINSSANWLLRRLGLEPTSNSELIHSEEELRLLFSASHKQSTATTLGREIVLNALDLRRRIARDVMRPRQEIAAINTEASVAECLDIAEKTRFSRFPICEAGNLDKTLGVIHIKDLYAMRLKARRGSDFLPAARKIIYAPETARLEKLLQLFLERKLHFAIIVDEYGGTRGLLTLENILEELVGQIQDEFDQEKPPLVKTGEHSWDLLGTLPVQKLSSLVGQPLEEEGISTTSGWVTHRLGGFPKLGDVLVIGSFQLRVEELEGRRVARLKLEQVTKPADSIS
jgi:CBS domain containing-hemolysin-like protein